MGRAEYNNLSVNGSTVVDDANRTITITSGNPALKPRVSDNFDVSIEHYIPANGMLSIGLFEKSIANDIYRRRVLSNVNLNGVNYAQTYTRSENAHSAKIRGLETGVIISSFRFISPLLADFGLTGNLAFLDGGFDIEMANGTERRLYGTLRQPTRIGNASLSWTPGKYEARVAYRHSNKSLFSTSATAASLDEYIGPENRIDLQMRYKLTSELMVFAEGRNLTEEGEDQGLSYGRNHYTREYGMSVWVGVTYKK
jgi:TonB-dependent receptor